MDLDGPLIKWGRGDFLYPVFAGNEVCEHRPAVLAGGEGIDLSRLMRLGVGTQQSRLDGGPRQKFSSLRVLFDGDELGLFVIGDIDHLVFPLGDRHIIGGFCTHDISLRGGQFLDDQRALGRKRDADLTVFVGGLRPDLGRNMGIGIADAEGRALQRH